MPGMKSFGRRIRKHPKVVKSFLGFYNIWSVSSYLLPQFLPLTLYLLMVKAYLFAHILIIYSN